MRGDAGGCAACALCFDRFALCLHVCSPARVVSVCWCVCAPGVWLTRTAAPGGGSCQVADVFRGKEGWGVTNVATGRLRSSG